MYWRNIKLLMLFLTMAIIASLFWNLHSQQQSQDASLRMQAVAIHSMEMEYRNWVIHNGGVYVPVSDHVQPSPWLNHVPERDIKTPSGKLLTLLNSSYVVRLVHENMLTSGNPLRDHIASPKPINPANTADTWERKALEAFARGDKEVASLDILEDGKTYFRYMKPMVTEESCLKCHARFGDKLGDIRGGVSVAIPVDTVMLAGHNERNAIITGHGLIWVLGMIGLLVGGRKQQQAIRAVEQGEETLHSNEERLHLATIAGNVGIWDWDVVNNKLAWDESMYALYGIHQEDFGGAYDAWISTLHPDDRKAADEEIQAALGGEREYAPEFRIVRPDGTVRKIKAASKTYYDAQGTPLRMVGTNIDITDRIMAEENCRAASQYARSLIEASLDPLVTISAEGKITDVNQATENATGRERAELIGTDFSDYFTEPDKARAGYQQVFAKGFVTDYPLALRHRDGHVTDVLYNASVYRNEAGEVLGVFAAARDITERKQEETIRMQLAALVESSNDAIIGKTRDGIITSWNKGAEKIYGYRADEIIGKHITTLAAPSRHAEIHEFLEKISKGETVAHYESERIRKDGGLIQVALTLSPIRDTSGTVAGVSTIARDITERKKVEFILRQSEEALKEAQRIAHLGSWHMDLATNEVVWSEMLYEMYGFDPALPPPLYTESMKLFTPESWERLSSSIARTTETGIPYELELEMVPKNGGTKWMLARGELVRDEHGTPIRVRGVVMDITGRKQAEQQLQRSEHGLSEAQRIAHLGNWELNLENNALIWSDEIYRIFEIDKDQFGASYDAFLNAIHPDDRAKVNKAYTDSVANKVPYDIVHRLQMPDGRIKYVNEKCETYYSNDGKAIRSIGTVHDVTELKLAENKITELNRNLEQRVIERTAQLDAANKELEAFAYSVSHDLRAPLRAIDGFSGIVLEEYQDKLDDEGKRLLSVVRENSKRMGQLIDDILKFSRAGRLELSNSEIDMEAMAHEVFAELQPVMDERKLHVEIEHLTPVFGDRAMMRQVFINLLSNALKFSHKLDFAKIKVGCSVEGGEAVYYVKDNGAGFDMQYADKLFGVFQRLHSEAEFEGTGIGLAIVKRIVTRHGGRVWAEGKIGEGAAIYFALPAKGASHES
jgi:PAS domain S-box-containing protein